MLLLRDFGLLPSARQPRKACKLLLDGGLQRAGGLNYGIWAKWTGRSETCVTGMVLSILSYFKHDDDRLDTITDHLLEQQMPDGGWNCRRPSGATHASVHTTISVLEGLHLYELHRGREVREVRAAQQLGREFLLVHRLFRSHRTAKSSSPYSLAFLFHPDGITTSSAHSTTSRPSMRLVTRAWPRQSTSSVAGSARTGAGRSNTRTKEDVFRA